MLRQQFRPEGIEYYGQLNLMKAGLRYADTLTTVSPTYAGEIATPEFGHGLDGVIRGRAAQVSGILNGVDRDEWDPATDKHLEKAFSAAKPAGKAECKTALLRELDLPTDDELPLVGVISRLWDQKGLDLAAGVLPRFLREQKLRFVLLGSGDAALENEYRRLAADFPRLCAVRIGYDNGLSHRIEAGSDFFLMPSRFEPCGLNQMYSMAYGTLPIVRATGGLADTVTGWDGLLYGIEVSAPDLGWNLRVEVHRAGAVFELAHKAVVQAIKFLLARLA